jgi:hypothetical protein
MTRREMNWKIIRSVVPIIVLGALLYYSQSLQPNYKNLDPSFETDAKDLLWRFQMDEGEQFINTIVKINGRVTSLDGRMFILDHQIVCSPDSVNNEVVSIGQKKVVKGRCLGYDDLLDEVRLDHVFILE